MNKIKSLDEINALRDEFHDKIFDDVVGSINMAIQDNFDADNYLNSLLEFEIRLPSGYYLNRPIYSVAFLNKLKTEIEKSYEIIGFEFRPRSFWNPDRLKLKLKG